MDFMRAFENQKKLIKERQEKLLQLQKNFITRPKNKELLKSAKAKFK